MLTDTLNTGEVDYLTDDNTAVIDEQQLPPLTAGWPSGRKLLAAAFVTAEGSREVGSPGAILGKLVAERINYISSVHNWSSEASMIAAFCIPIRLPMCTLCIATPSCFHVPEEVRKR